jgi:hypothetical protein
MIANQPTNRPTNQPTNPHMLCLFALLMGCKRTTLPLWALRMSWLHSDRIERTVRAGVVGTFGPELEPVFRPHPPPHTVQWDLIHFFVPLRKLLTMCSQKSTMEENCWLMSN